jgi:hypothetical protein
VVIVLETECRLIGRIEPRAFVLNTRGFTLCEGGTIGGASESLFEAVGLGVGQMDADHGRRRLEETGSPPPSTNQTASADL